MSADVYARAQQAAEEHVEAIYAHMDGDSDVDPTLDPFCGCNTCLVREVLNAVRPLFGELAAAEDDR